MLHLFKTTGRLRRRVFFWRVLALYVLAFAFYGLPALGEEKFSSADRWWKNVAIGGILLCFYLMFTHSIKRLHDIGLRGWWLLLTLVPVASLVVGAGMQFVAGTPGTNRFGPDPKRPALRTTGPISH